MLHTSAPSEKAIHAVQPFTSTVPREYVHRAAIAEVFLTTGWTRADEAHFTIGAQWPRAHSFFGPVGGTHYDPMMVAETIRQVGALLAHVGFDVPLGHQFLMWELNYRVVPGLLAVGGAPAELRLHVTCTDIRRRAGRLAGLSYEVVVTENGRTVAVGDARYTCTSPEVYRRLRADRLADPFPAPGPLPAPVAPAVVGRWNPSDVVLSPAAPGVAGGARWQLRVNTDHPVLFDHPGDHIPGMVLLEAARQAARSRVPQGREMLPAAMDSTFHRYAEFGSPVWIEIDQAVDYPGTSESLLSVTGRQDDELVFTAITTVTALPKHTT